VQLYFKLYLHTGKYSQVSWCSSLSSNKFQQEPSLGYPGAACFKALNSIRNLLSGLLVQLSFKLYLQTGTYCWVSWCSSFPSYPYTQEPTLGYPGEALFQAMHTHRNLLLGILVQLYFMLYLHAGPTLGYPGATLFQAIHTHKNLLLVILVQLSFKLYIQTRTYSWVSWCSSISSYMYIQTQKPTLRYPGVAFFQAVHTHRNLLLGILVQLYFKQCIHTGTYSWVSWCSSISCYTYTQEPTLGYPGATLFQAIHTHKNLLLVILVQLSFKL